MTVFEKIKSLTPIELAMHDWMYCPFYKCDKDILNMSNAEVDATCVKCIHEWLLSEYKAGEKNEIK